MNIKFNNKKGLPGGPNEISSTGSISVEGYKIGSPDFNNDFNIIESSNITMEGVPFPVMGTDNFGNSEIMMPGANYKFPGNTVFEVPLAQIGGAIDSAYDQHPFEKFAESQGMDVNNALQIVLSNPQEYPEEIIAAAEDYQNQLEMKNPVNDKQDEVLYTTKDQQELEEAQDGTETSLFDLNTDIRKIYPDLDEIIENRDWDDTEMDDRFRNWIEQQKENISYKENKRKGESKKDFKNRLDDEASRFYYAYQGIEPHREKYFIDKGKERLIDYREGERTERGDAAKAKAINYFTEYLDSPLLKTRLENLYPGDPEKQQAVIDAKKEQLSGLLIEEQDPSEFQNMLDDPFSPFTLDYYDTGTLYKPYANLASFNDAQMDYIKEREGYVHDILPGSIVNEISHALNVNVTKNPKKDVYDDDALYSLGYIGNYSPKQVAINPNVDMSPEEIELAKKFKFDLDPNQKLTEVQEHDYDPYNVKSDIDTIRYELYDAGMYDFNDPDFKFTQDHIDHLRNNPTKFHKSQLMLDMYEDEDLLNNLNIFTDTSSMPTNIAKYGVELPKAQDGIPSWMNFYNYSGDFNRFGIPIMYPSVEGNTLNEAFANAQKNHPDSEMFLWKGDRYLNELKGKSKHHQPTQDILDRIANSETLDQSVKDNFLKLYTDVLNSPRMNFYSKDSDQVDSWSYGRPQVNLKNIERSDDQLVLDLINEFPHVLQHNTDGRFNYLSNYGKQWLGSILKGGDRDDLYHQHGTYEFDAHAGEIRPWMEDFVYNESRSQIGSRSNKKIDEEMEQLKKYKGPANVPDDPTAIKPLPIAETGEELDSDGEIDEEDFSAFNANMKLTNEQELESERIAGYVRNEDGDLMLGVDYGDVTPVTGTVPLGFMGGIPKLLKGAYYGAKGLNKYLPTGKFGGSLPNFQNTGEVSIDNTYVAPFNSPFEFQNIEESNINRINIPGSPVLNFTLNKVFPEGWDQVNEEFKSATEALGVDDNLYKNKSVLNWMVQNLAPALKTVWHGTNKLGMNPAQTEKNMKIALETVQNEFVPWSEAKPLLSEKYPFHDAAMDAAGMFHPSIDLVHMKEKYDSGDPDWPWYGLSILPFLPAGSFINKVVGKGGKINQKAFNALDPEQKQVIEFYQSIDETKKLVHPVTGKETNITAYLDDINRIHKNDKNATKWGLNQENLSYHNIVSNYINQLKSNKLIDENLNVIGDISPNVQKLILDWKGTSQHYTKLSRTMLEYEDVIGKKITSKNVDEILESDKFWKWIDEQPGHVTSDWLDYTKVNDPVTGGASTNFSAKINKENFSNDIRNLVDLENVMKPLQKDLSLITWRNASSNLYPNINRSIQPGLISTSSYPHFVFGDQTIGNPQNRHILNVKSGTPIIGMDATKLNEIQSLDLFGAPQFGVNPSQIRRNYLHAYPSFMKESEMVISPRAKFTYTGRSPLFRSEGSGVMRNQPYPLKGKSQAQNIFWDVSMKDGGSLPKYQDQGEVLLPMEELENIDLIEPANQNYYPDYDFYDISKQKEELFEKYNSPAFKDRYFKQYKNVTGNDMTEDEWNRRIAEQIEYTKQVPNQATPINYDLPLNDENAYDFYTEKGRHNLERMNPDLLQKILNESRGHVQWTLNEETGEYDFNNLSLLGPREFQALARFYAPGGPESFSYLYGEDGVHPYADIIKTHEVSHLYNSPQSPLWKGVEGYTTPTNELDFYKNIFDQQGKYDENFIEQQSPHISNIEEIGAGKVMFEKALKDFNIWDPNEGPFTEKHYKKLIKNLDNPDFLAHPGTGAGGFIDFQRDPLGLVGAQNEGATYLDDLGILNPIGVPEEYAPWGGTGYINFEFPGDYDRENFFSGDEIHPRNQLLHSENILKQIDSKFQIPEHLNREGDDRRGYKRTQRFRNKNVKDFLSDKFTLDDLETGATWYGEDGYYNEEGGWDDISGITVPFTGRRKRILQNFLGRPVFPREADYYGSVADKKPIDLIGDDRFEGLFSNKNHRYFSSKYNPKNYKLRETFEMDVPGYKYATKEQQEEINKQFNNLFTEEVHTKINDILKKNSRFHKENSQYYGDKPDDWEFNRQELTEEELKYLKNFEQNYIDLKEKIVNDLYDHYDNKLNDTKENVFKYLNEIAMDEGDSNVISAKQGIELPKAKKGGASKKYTRLYKDYKKHIAGEKVSPTVLKELYKMGLTNETKKELNLKNIKFNFEYNLDNVDYKKGGQINLNLNQQIKFYEDYVKGSFDGGPKEAKANQIFEKLNKMYYLPTKKTGGNVLSYLHSISKNIS